jgi:hypothetical protein
VLNPPAAKKYCYWTNDKIAPTPEEWIAGTERHEGSWWGDWDQWVRQFAGGSVPARQPGDGALTPIEDAPGSYVKEVHTLDKPEQALDKSDAGKPEQAASDKPEVGKPEQASDKPGEAFVERVQGALQSLDVPTKQDVDALSKQVNALTKVANKLSAQLGETQSGVKTKTKRTSRRGHR